VRQEQTHTPGPWLLGENTPSELDQPIYANGTEGCVGICNVDLDEAEEAEANARLIAAAPDLLAACKWFIDPPHPIGSNAEKVLKFAEIARQAIAKAEGGAS
jgi:hypothetical protein